MWAVRRIRILLKQLSPDTFLTAGGDGVHRSEPSMSRAVKGEVTDIPPGSKSMARMEREARNLGRPLCLPIGREAAGVGKANDKKAFAMGFKRGVRSSHGRAGQASCIQQGAQTVAKGTTEQHSSQRKHGLLRLNKKTMPTSLRGIANRAAETRLTPMINWGWVQTLWCCDHECECSLQSHMNINPCCCAEASCSEEPGARKPHAGICEGGTEQSVSLPRFKMDSLVILACLNATAHRRLFGSSEFGRFW